MTEENQEYSLDEMRQAAQTEAQMQMMDQNTPGFTNIIKYLVDDKSIPQALKEHLWSLTDKENAISRLNENDVKRMFNHMQIIIMSDMLTKGDGEYTWIDDFQMRQVEHKAYLKWKGRSEGGFERIQQTVQTRKMELTGGSRMAVPKQGILGKFPILGKLMGRGGRPQ